MVGVVIVGVVVGVVVTGVVIVGVVVGVVVTGVVIVGVVGIVGVVAIGVVIVGVVGTVGIATDSVGGVVLTGSGSLSSSCVRSSARSTPTTIASSPATIIGPVGPRPVRSDVPQCGQNGASSATCDRHTGHARVICRPSGSVSGSCGGVAIGGNPSRGR